MTENEISNLFEKFIDKKILIIGDVMLDAYCYGKVERISPEAPVPVVSCFEKESRLGGAANVALNLLSLGANPILCAVVGNDEKANVFLELMEKKNLQTNGIITDNLRPTTSKTRIMSQNQQLLRIDEEVDTSVNKTIENKILQSVFSICSANKIEAIVFEDYDKGAITPYIIEQVVAFANNVGIPTLADPKKRNFHNYKNLTLFKPNFKELTEGLNQFVEKENFEEVFNVSKQFIKKTGNKLVMTTLSEAGILICDDHEYFHLPAEIRDIADVSGAGDTVISVTALCMAAGLSSKKTAIIANLAGGLVCEKSGVVPINSALLKKETILFFSKSTVEY